MGKSKKQVLCPGETRMLSQIINVIDNGGKTKRNCRLKGSGLPFSGSQKRIELETFGQK